MEDVALAVAVAGASDGHGHRVDGDRGGVVGEDGRLYCPSCARHYGVDGEPVPSSPGETA